MGRREHLASERVRRVLWALLAALALGCSDAAGRAASLKVGRQDGRLTPAAADVLVVADTQIQYLYGGGFLMRSGVADRIARTAIRPVQLDMFSPSLLRDVCDGNRPIFHLGDGGNASCVQELDRLFDVMRACRPRGGWVFTPGNHDGFYLGSSDTLCDDHGWAVACSGEANVLSKDKVVGRYVAELGLESAPFRGPGNLKNASGVLLDIAWRIEVEKDARFRSYVTQLVDVPAAAPAGRGCFDPAGKPRRVLGILIDTAAYSEYPRVRPASRDAGTTGEIIDEQRKVIEHWVESDPAALFVLFGHHPVGALTGSSRDFVKQLVGEHQNVVLFVTAHTHAGYLFVHDFGERPLVELNVASRTDVPNEYRDLRIACDGPRVLLASDYNPEEHPPVCEEGWLPARAAFTRYQEGRGPDGAMMQLTLLETQAETWLRMLEKVGFADQAASKLLHAQLTAALGTWGPLRARELRKVSQRAECWEALDDVGGTGGLPRWCGALARENGAPKAPALPAGQIGPIARRRLDFKRCMALRASQYERCSGGCAWGLTGEPMPDGAVLVLRDLEQEKP